MEKIEFLEQHVFAEVTTINKEATADNEYQFSESDFEMVLQRVAHFGLGVYTIETSFKGKPYASTTHEDFRKKATDPKWYQKAFQTYKAGQAGLTYAATYKVSAKLLARDSFKEEEE